MFGATRAGARLERLGAADLAAIRRHRGIIRHVLRLEGLHAQTAPDEGAREPGDQSRFAGARSGSLNHDRRDAFVGQITVLKNKSAP